MSDHNRRSDLVRPADEAPGKFRLDKPNGKLLGVCSGMARHFGWDPLTVRIVFVLGAVLGIGSFILLYLAIALLAD